jgi:hypothetical protein
MVWVLKTRVPIVFLKSSTFFSGFEIGFSNYAVSVFLNRDH